MGVDLYALLYEEASVVEADWPDDSAEGRVAPGFAANVSKEGVYKI